MNNITPLMYFAAHAPNEIPEWFICENIKERPKEPKIKVLKEYEDEIRQWICNLGYDLPKHLAHVQSAYEKYWKEDREWHKYFYEQRYFQWRWYYAKQMNSNANID